MKDETTRLEDVQALIDLLHTTVDLSDVFEEVSDSVAQAVDMVIYAD